MIENNCCEVCGMECEDERCADCMEAESEEHNFMMYKEDLD